MGANTNRTIVDQILELAARPCGVGSADIPGVKSDDLSARCCAMVRRGVLHRAGKGRGKTRYFTSEDAASKYDERESAVKTVTISQINARAVWSKDAETVITERTKVTICPPWQPRFNAVPLPGVHVANQRGRA